MKDSEELRLVAAAYVALLQVPLASYGRLSNQSVYAGLRDWLALLANVDAEEVQNAAEAVVYEVRK